MKTKRFWALFLVLTVLATTMVFNFSGASAGALDNVVAYNFSYGGGGSASFSLGNHGTTSRGTVGTVTANPAPGYVVCGYEYKTPGESVTYTVTLNDDNNDIYVSFSYGGSSSSSSSSASASSSASSSASASASASGSNKPKETYTITYKSVSRDNRGRYVATTQKIEDISRKSYSTGYGTMINGLFTKVWYQLSYINRRCKDFYKTLYTYSGLYNWVGNSNNWVTITSDTTLYFE